MAAKNRPRRTSAADTAARDRDVPDARDVGMHLRAAQHHDDLIEEARALRTAGKIREARAVEKRAAQVQQLLGALEAEGSGPIPTRPSGA